MSKKIVWKDTPYSPKRKAGTYSSYREFLEKANKLQDEQEKAREYLNKAKPAMSKLLEIRMTNGEPLTVMRPFRYQTTVMRSELLKGSEDAASDAAFYGGAANDPNNEFTKAKNATFVEVTKTINPGMQIILKGIDPNLREFIFQDALGEEHAIPYDSRDALMMQTNVFEDVQKLMEGKEE